VSWQEELRKLDEELAAGRISADDYRVRRDQVLSSAVSPGPEAPAPQKPSQGDSTQFIPTGPPQPVQPNYPPPPQGDRTQIVGGQDADKTQIVPGAGPDPSVWNQPMVGGGGGWQTARPQAGPSGADADRTQVVPGVPQQSYAGGQVPRPAPGQEQGPFSPPGGFPPPVGWQQQPAEDPNSPWGGSVFPPLTPTGSPDWIRQGPEVFDESPSGRKKVVLILLAVLLVLGAGAAIYFLAIKKDGDNSANNPPGGPPATNQTQKPTSTTKPRPTDPNVAALEDMPKPPASLQQQGKVLDVSELVSLKLMDAPEAQILTTAGVKKVIWRSAVRKSPDDGPTPDTLSAMMIPTDSPTAAAKLATDLRGYQEAHSWLYIAEPLPNMPPTVNFEKLIKPEVATYRGLWASGNYVIRMTTIQNPFTDEASLSGSYRNHTEAMLRVFPPN
jgi:flagellar basal body-associated protein FliL